MNGLQPTGISEWGELRKAVQVWHVSPDALSPDSLQRRCMDWLAPRERTRRERFRTDALRHEYLTARALCRWALSRYTGVAPRDWQFVDNPHGKPAIAVPREFDSLHFNLTHTRGLVGCAVTRAGEVGLDAEDTSRAVDVAELAGQVFSARERECLSGVTPHLRAARFYEYWVLKEAYLKALGTGLSMPPDQVTIEWNDEGQPMPIGDWQMGLHYPTPGHVAGSAVPLRRGAAPLPITWLAADIADILS